MMHYMCVPLGYVLSCYPCMLRDGVVVRDGVLHSVYADPDSRGAEIAKRGKAIMMVRGVCVAGSAHSVETWRSQGE